MLFRRTKRYHANPLSTRRALEANFAQGKVEGFSLPRHQDARIAVIGLGGLGTPVAHGLMRKGIGEIHLFDDDVVELSNLPRQLFTCDDIGKYKVHSTGKHLKRSAIFPITIKAHPVRFQEHFTGDLLGHTYDLIIAGVDNNPSRRAVSEFAHKHAIPVIHSAVARDASALYVFVQEPDAACWACSFPQFLDDTSYPCGLPGSIDVLTVAAGHVLYATDTILGSRPRHWNRRVVFLDGSIPDQTTTISVRPDCPICKRDDLIAA
ncbi:MAG: HesA/MoeB/ThiF family protein [Hyphomicrobiaceae bacterium]